MCQQLRGLFSGDGVEELRKLAQCLSKGAQQPID